MHENRFPDHPDQFGFATTAQLREAGFSEWNLHELALNGQRVTRSVYSSTVGPWSPTSLAVAGGLWAGASAALTGLAAVRRWGVDDVPEPSVLRYLVPPEGRTRRNGLGMVTQRSRRVPSRTPRTGVPVAPLERALADAGRHKELRPEELMGLTLSALHRRRTTIDRLAREVADGGDAGTGGVQDAVLAFRRGAWSRPEAVLGDGVRARPDLPPMYANPRLVTTSGRFLGVPDGYFEGEGVAVQVHSKRYHTGADDAGGDRWVATLDRDLEYQAEGILVVPVAPIRLYEDLDGFLDHLTRVVISRRGQGPAHVVVG